jgi:hypothetical protein
MIEEFIGTVIGIAFCAIIFLPVPLAVWALVKSKVN